MNAGALPGKFGKKGKGMKGAKFGIGTIGLAGDVEADAVSVALRGDEAMML